MTPFIRHQPYRGPVRAVVLDWAGTVIDYGCRGPVAVFVDVFAKFGIAVSPAEVRPYMGLMKKDHLRRLCREPAIAGRWTRIHGRRPDESEVEALFVEMEPMMVESIGRHADLIPGVLEAVEEFRRAGIRIGTSTGYTRPIMEALLPAAAEQGFEPDAVVCSSDVPAGRPYPWMCYRNALALEVYPLEAMVKIGDTISDIQEGRNAGMWSVGVTCSGNELGWTAAEVAAAPPAELQARLSGIARRFREAGAHETAPGVADCPEVVARINRRLAAGERS